MPMKFALHDLASTQPPKFHALNRASIPYKYWKIKFGTEKERLEN
jgi:hypothetical protein